jgi:hypothetical protein
MSSFEGSYDSILQGVSQQIPRMRLPGQVAAQVNMLSDPVTNARRRPGAEFQYSYPLPLATTDSIKAWDVDISGFKVNVIMCTNGGTILILNDNYDLLATLQNDYLIATNTSQIKAATVSDELFFANTSIMPELTPPLAGVITPNRRGFAYISTGTFSKTFDVVVVTNLGTITGRYTTPAVSEAGAATAALPENIAASIATNLAGAGIATIGVTVTREGPYLYFAGATNVTRLVTNTNSGALYVSASGASKVRSESNLPASLPTVADGYIVAVGQQKVLTYYRYEAATISWLETGAYNSPSGITSMPVSLRYDQSTTSWVLLDIPFEGRLAGDDDTNPIPKFVLNGITGIGTYQGRFILLVGAQVVLSSSRESRRFMRSTVTSLLDEDAIAIGSGANSSATYEYAVPFQKDLLLFSAKYQALIPGSNQAITPRNATVLVTSTFSADMSSEPLPIGRTMLYPTPLSADFFGVLEMISSQYTDSQYVSNQATAHLPKYMAGSCRFSASSSVASMVTFGQSRDKRGIIVYQYLWSGDEKVQQAWHRWDFAYDVATTYFSGESVNFLFVRNGRLIGTKVDPKLGVLSFASGRRPYLDIYTNVTVVDNVFTLPAWMLLFDPSIGDKVKLSQTTGDLAGELVGIESIDAGTGVGRTVRSYRNGVVAVGLPYRSLLSPTPPQMQDRNGQKMDSNKLTVLRYGVNTQNSSEFQIAVTDTAQYESLQTQGTLRWSSAELDLGHARYADYSRAIIPARTNADSTSLQIFTEGLGELNVVAIDYVCRYNQRITRR